jgi:branched-subunit amino acid ABC-type transport system permease component
VVQSVSMLYFPPAFRDAAIFGSYILMALARPQGLFGRF